jgi:hypothetical protein
MRKPNPRVSEIIDVHGNKIICSEENNIVNIYLKLKSGLKKRHIGYINGSEHVFYVVRKRIKHLHHNTNGYGFNYKIINETKRFDTLHIQDEKSVWRVPVDFILQHGKFNFYKEQGFEKQIFINLDLLNDFLIESFF